MLSSRLFSGESIEITPPLPLKIHSADRRSRTETVESLDYLANVTVGAFRQMENGEESYWEAPSIARIGGRTAEGEEWDEDLHHQAYAEELALQETSTRSLHYPAYHVVTLHGRGTITYVSRVDVNRSALPAIKQLPGLSIHEL